MDESFERLKEELYGMGTDYIDEFLGFKGVIVYEY